jgi:hypothetical protein
MAASHKLRQFHKKGKWTLYKRTLYKSMRQNNKLKSINRKTKNCLKLKDALILTIILLKLDRI